MIVFLIGFFAQIGQIIMFREVMALFHGTELLFGAVLGGWVIWTAMGAATTEFFLKRTSNLSSNINPLKLLAHSSLLNGFLLGLQIIFLRFCPLFFSNANIPQTFSFYGAITTVFFASFLFAFLIGAQFTLALRVNPRKRLGFLYRVEALGAMVGGILTSFVLVELIKPIQLAFITGAFFTAGFIFILIKKSRTAIATYIMAAFAIFMLVLLAVLPLNINRTAHSKYWSKPGEGFSLLETKETRYGRIEIVKNEHANQYLVFHNSALVSCMEQGAGDQYEQQLAEICLTQHPAPARVLLIGGALSSLPENILEHGIETLTIVELDPMLFSIYENFSGISRKGEQITIAPEDGRSFVRSGQKDYYDMVVVFCAEPDNASMNRFCTKEFFRQAERIIKSDGVLCLFLPTHGAAHEYLSEALINRTSSVYKAMKSVFAHMLAVQVNGHLLIGSPSENRISLDPGILSKRLFLRPQAGPFNQFQVNGKIIKVPIPRDQLSDYFSSMFAGVLEQNNFFSNPGGEVTRAKKFQNMLESAGAKINLDSHTITIAYSMIVWEDITAINSTLLDKSLLVKIFDFIGGGNLSNIIIFPGILIFINLLLFIIFLFSRLKRQHRPALALQRRVKNYSLLSAAGITGCISITLEIILLSLYQSLTGYLYYSVGILMAIFMGGLALGAKLTDKPSKKIWLLLTGIFLLMIVLCVFTGYSSALLSGIRSNVIVTLVFMLLMLINGILCGAVFPLLGYLTSGWQKGRPGAWVYAFDLLGAGLGALLIAPFIIPIAGISNTLLLLTILLFSLLILSVPLAILCDS